MTKLRILPLRINLLRSLLLTAAFLAGPAVAQKGIEVTPLKEIWHFEGVWNWQHENTSGFVLDPDRDKFLYIYNNDAYTLPYSLEEGENGNYVLEFALPDGNHAQFEWADQSPAKGRFWLKDTEKPITETTMHRVHWEYGDEEHWPFKGDRNVQSPIEVKTGGASQVPAHYGEMEVASVVNNGHAFQLNYKKEGGGKIEPDFKLVQFHFHSPSEHTQTGYAGWTDEKGKQYPGHYAMEVHFVHTNGRFGGFKEVAPQRPDLAVIGVFIREGERNDELQKIMDECPITEGENKSPSFGKFNASDLMPHGGTLQTYKGSLTTPPLSSGVTWFVMDEPIEASRDQINYFREVMKHNTNRPIQIRRQ